MQKTKKQKKLKRLYILLAASAIGLLVGAIVLGGPVRITFDTNPPNASGHRVPVNEFVGERIGDIRRVPRNLDLPSPIRPGYRFMGWYSDLENGSPITRITSRRMHLQARWERVQPMASLHVDGHFLRNAIVPSPVLQTQHDGLGDCFVPNNSWDASILDAFNLDTFLGWYFFNENGRRIELRFSATRNPAWSMFEVLDNNQVRHISGIGTGSEDMQFMPRYDLALNAMFVESSGHLPGGPWYGDIHNPNMANQMGRQIDFVFRRPNRRPDTSIWFYSNLGTTGTNAMPQPATGRLGTFVSGGLPRPNRDVHLAGEYFVGWRLGGAECEISGHSWRLGLGDDADIFNPGAFFLCPTLHERLSVPAVLGGRPRLVFNAVTLPVPTGGSASVPVGMNQGTFTKSIAPNGRVSMARTSPTVPPGSISPLVINDIIHRHRMENMPVNLDFGGAYTSQLRSTVVDEDYLQQGNSFPIVTRAYQRTRTVQARNGMIPLPIVTNLAVPGRVFAGWHSSLCGNVFPGGINYRIPRGASLSASFTAVWVDAKQLIHFDANGGGGVNPETFRGVNPGSTISLPTPTRFGYSFAGWKLTNTQTEDFTSYLRIIAPQSPEFNSFTITPHAQRLVAVWTPRAIPSVGAQVAFLFNDPILIEPSYFGDVIVLRRNTNAAAHHGWRFQDGTIRNSYNRFYFGASFINTIRIVVDEQFATRHAGSGNEVDFFERGRPDSGGRNIFAWQI